MKYKKNEKLKDKSAVRGGRGLEWRLIRKQEKDNISKMKYRTYECREWRGFGDTI